MGSFMGDARKKGRDRRYGIGGETRITPSAESLEQRALLAAADPSSQIANDLLETPLARSGTHLVELFAAFQAGPEAVATARAELEGLVVFRGDKVGVDVYGGKTDFERFESQLKALGLEVVATDTNVGVVEGFLPIGQLLAVAEMAQTISMSPIYVPVLHTQGVANNQADDVLARDFPFPDGGDALRAEFGVDGTGVTVGVLSDSVDEFQGGLADSQSTGDLPANVNVLSDFPGGSDEGRAMLELIHDIAPGADLAFHTAVIGGPAGFADGIRALANDAGAEIIVDDIGFATEPIFQDGLVSQAVTDVVTNNDAIYFSAAGNESFSGIDSNFRGVDSTVTGIGAGRFHDFDPGPGVVTALELDFTQPDRVLFQWDDPWFTGTAATNLDFFLLDANNAIVIQGTTNNIGSATPFEFDFAPGAGTFQLVVQVAGGPDPTRFRFQGFGSEFTVDPNGNIPNILDGGTFLASTFGHPTSEDAIGTGAVAYFDAPPFPTAQNPIPSESFSSAGPSLFFFDPQGNRLPSSELRLKPDVSAPDASNTTFFIPGVDIEPDGFPNFLGTSAAAPNLAAIAALMREFNPSVTAAEVELAFESTATPLNGSAGGYESQGGFGLANARAALEAIDELRVVATTPANGDALAAFPSSVTVQFSKAVDPATLDASDLTFPVTPAGAVVDVAAPTLIDPLTAVFPISINATGTALINGTFVFSLANDSITAIDGSSLIGVSASFDVADATAPQVTNTIVQGRILIIEFSEAMRPSTIIRENVMLVRTGGAPSFGMEGNVTVTDDPRALLFYDPINNRAIYDLRDLPQTELPADTYAIAVTDSVLDATGNALDGEFTGIFPSGDGTAGGTFVQVLGALEIEPPLIAGFGLAPGSDTGIPGDQNTSLATPTFSGQVFSSFPGTNAGLLIAVQFIQEQPDGEFDLVVGANGQGFAGTPDLIVATNDDGSFSFQPPFELQDGFHRVRIVVVGESENPPLPGLGTQGDFSFRVDTTSPLVTASSIPDDARIPNLRNITLNVADPVSPSDPNDFLAVPPQLDLPALNPETANNLSNYSLINLGPDRILSPGPVSDDVDFSAFISSATFVSTSNRELSTDPYTGRIELSFVDGLPSGRYVLVARTTSEFFSGITDAAGNALDNDLAEPGNQDFHVFFDLQPEPAFVTGFEAISPSALTPGTMVTSGPRAFYEVPVPGFTPRAEAPPESFTIDFSNTLEPRDYSNAVRLIRSADAPGSPADGDFGVGAESGFSEVTGLSVTLVNEVPGATIGQPGFQNRLLVELPDGLTLAPDYYRIVIANEGGEEIRDIFGNVSDLEFLGNETPDGEDFEVFLPDGTFREGLTGDTVEGGSFVTGFSVVPGQRTVIEPGLAGPVSRTRGNIIFVRPDYADDPFSDIDDPDGSIERPFSTLVTEAVDNFINNGNLNAQSNFGTGFNPQFDRNANGQFDRSAFFEAELAGADGPVVIVALPGIERPVIGEDLGSVIGETVQEPYVIAPPAGVNPALPENNASASVPELTTLAFSAGTAVKFFNASLFVQNQGSALQLLGGPSPGDQVIFTSFLDDSVGGDTNGDDTDTVPTGGDWGGVVFRNFNDTINRGGLNPDFPVDGTLGLSGASDVMSIVNQATLQFGGGAVPQTIGERFDTITLFNSRPAITNTTIADSAAAPAGLLANATQAAISADLDSLREDEIARGPLIRRIELVNNSVNGILLRPAIGTLQVQETDAIGFADNPASDGAARIFTIDDPLPYVLASQLVIGQRLNLETGGETEQDVSSRLYVQPGMLVKSTSSASVAVLNNLSSLNIGDRTYINAFDLNPSTAPTDLEFSFNTLNDAKPIFTSLFDDSAETFFFDPITSVTRVIVPAGPTDNDTTNPEPTPGLNDPTLNPDLDQTRLLRWGSISITPGAVAVIDEAEFRYGGGALITPIGSLPPRQVIDLTDNISAFLDIPFALRDSAGATVSITNNDFFDNFDAPIVAEPDQLLAADPLRPLLSGNPFFRNNLMERNSINGLAVKTTLGVVIADPGDQTNFFFSEIPVDDLANLNVNSVWDDTDLIHVLRGSINLGPNGFFTTNPVPDTDEFTTERLPDVTQTLQSSLPGTLLPNGEQISLPGESLYVKMFDGAGGYGPGNPGPGTPVDPDLPFAAASDAYNIVGPGFAVGFDDGVDPPALSPLLDPGYGSQLRIIGIGANESTGQQRVPVVITSLRDDTEGPVIRGQQRADTFFADVNPNGISGPALSAPEPGDGGIIAFGGGSLFDYNLYDPRNGSIIDNADLKFLHRVEFQGGSLIDVDDFNLDGNITEADDGFRAQKLGVTPETQNNAQHGWTVSNSNLTDFQDAGIFADQGFPAIVQIIDPLTGQPVGFPLRVGGLLGQPTNLFLVNNTISNMPVAVEINGPTSGSDDTAGQNPARLVMLHNTLFNNGVGLRTDSVNFDGDNGLSHVYFIAMNNIFDGGTVGISDPNAVAVRTTGQIPGSELLFNVYNNYTTTLDITNTNPAAFRGNNNPIFGNPLFADAANGDFFLQAGSVAIDAALSELGPVIMGDMLFPLSDDFSLDSVGGTRNAEGRSYPFGGFLPFFGQDPQEIVTLPGTPGRPFFDQFIATTALSGQGAQGPATNIATYNFAPLSGERDLAGLLRIDVQDSPNLGFGSRPFFDVGAREFRVFDPPQVTNEGAPDVDLDGEGDAVFASIVNDDDSISLIDLYEVGGIAGTNVSPQEIQIQFDEQLDPQSVNNFTVLLFASGGDGIFGNGNSPGDRAIDLSGRLSFDPETRRLRIALGATNLILPNDQYQIVLVGTGSSVLLDPQGNALDGENIGATGQLPLPSGDGFPGGDFVVEFTIDTNPPEIVPGTFTLESDSGALDGITNVSTTAFSGTITDIFPPTMPLVNATVLLDIDSDGDGNFERLGVGSAVTDANGDFLVAVGIDAAGVGIDTSMLPLPDSAFDVGPDGQLGTDDDSGFSFARVRVIDVSGNVSDPADPNAITDFILDTAGPQITDVTPAPGSLVSDSGVFTVSFTANENLLLSTLMAPGAITATGAGLDGIFGTPDDVPIGVDLNSLTLDFLATDPMGPVQVTFNVTGATQNDIYRVTVTDSVTDIATNALDGEFDGGFPTGNGVPGGSFDLDLIVFLPGNTDIIYVSPSGLVGGDGSRANPFGSIAAGLAVATIGDTVAALPGAYNEAVNLKSLVRLVSADVSSTDTNLVSGSAQATIIRAPINPNGPTVTVSGVDLLAGNALLDTELSGFAIVSPLTGVSTGSILEESIGLDLVNSGGLYSRNYVLNGETGVRIDPTGGSVGNPVFINNGIIGNLTGFFINDTGGTGTTAQPVEFTNNTVALNNTGVVISGREGGPTIAEVSNNIFWQNNDRAEDPTGTGLFVFPEVAVVQSNMFSEVAEVGGTVGFDPNELTTVPGPFGNFLGEPAFEAPRDPRPGFGNATVFLLDGNFDLRATSDAIDAALNAVAPPTDFLGRGRVDIPGAGFPGTGPADVGAFEFQPSGINIPGLGGLSLSSTPAPVTAASSIDGDAFVRSLSADEAASFANFSAATEPVLASSATDTPAGVTTPASGNESVDYTVNLDEFVPQLNSTIPLSTQAGPYRRYLESLQARLAERQIALGQNPFAAPGARAFESFLQRSRVNRG